MTSVYRRYLLVVVLAAAVAGFTLLLLVCGWSGRAAHAAPLLQAPANDDFDSAFVISVTPYTYTQDTSLATTAADDPVLSCGSGGQESHSVWYRFTPPHDGSLHVDTGGSDYDTVLAVWTGSRGSLAEVACHDDVNWPSDPTSSVDVAVTAGTTYHIEIVAYDGGAGGSLTLHADFAVIKPLYLHNVATPVTIVDGTSTTEIMDRRQVWGGEATVTFDDSPIYLSYLYPGLAEALALQGTVNIPLYLEADNNQNSSVTAGIADLAPDGSTTIIGTDSLMVPRGSDGWYTFTISAVDYTVAQGHALILGMRTANPSQDVTLHYDSATHDSRVELPARNYVHVDWASAYDDAYPAGTERTAFVVGEPAYVRASASDPFGSYDVTTATLTITSTAYTMSQVYSSTVYKIYETAYTPTMTGTYHYTVTVSEGSEGVVADTATGSFYVSFYSVSVYPDAMSTTDPDTSVDYGLTVENTGAITDTFDITVSASTQGWATELYVAATLIASDTNGDGTWDWVDPAYDADTDGAPDFTLGVGGTQDVVLRKIVPPAVGEVVDTTRLVATSWGDPLASDAAVLTTSTMVAVEHKQLHLLESGAADTMSTQPGSTNSRLILRIGNSHLWTQSPPFASDFDLRQGALTVNFYVSFSWGWPSPPLARVTVYSGTTVLDYDEQTITGVGWYTFTIANPNATIPAGDTLAVEVACVGGGWFGLFVMRYGGSDTYDARLDMPTKTYVDVEEVETNSACHPDGSLLFSQGQAMTITARVSDPFGSYDVAGANVEVTDPGGVPVVPGLAMTPVVTASGAITYEYVHTIPTTATLGLYTVVVTGTESNGVYDTRSTIFYVQSPAALISSLSATPATANTGQAITVTMTVTNGGQAAAEGVTPSPLTLGGTGSAVLASGPSPPSADIPGGGTQTFTWVYTATGVGTVSWSGNATGSDANSCVPVSSPTTTSNDVLIQRPAALVSSLSALPIQVSIGQTITVTMRVTNTGEATADGVTPSALTLGGTGSAVPASGPSPAAADIPGGGVQTFVWTYTATGAGTVNWSGNATGTDANSGASVSSPSTTSNDVLVQTPAALISSLSAVPTTVGVGETITVTMQVTNTGQAGASDVAPSALVASGTGAVAYVSGPSPAAADIAGGGVQAFVWTYTATDAGTVDWSGNASGTDANSGVPVSSAWTTSNQIEVLGIGPITKTVAPETVGAGQAVTYTIIITGSRQFLVITDTLSAGFTYVTNTTVYNGSPFANPAVNGQTLSWNFGSPQNVPATLRFVATASSNPGIYYNDAGVTLVAGQVFTTGPTAPVTVGWPVFEIVASAGGQTIRVRVRMVNGLPVILSWEFLP